MKKRFPFKALLAVPLGYLRDVWLAMVIGGILGWIVGVIIYFLFDANWAIRYCFIIGLFLGFLLPILEYVFHFIGLFVYIGSIIIFLIGVLNWFINDFTSYIRNIFQPGNFTLFIPLTLMLGALQRGLEFVVEVGFWCWQRKFIVIPASIVFYDILMWGQVSSTLLDFLEIDPKLNEYFSSQKKLLKINIRLPKAGNLIDRIKSFRIPPSFSLRAKKFFIGIGVGFLYSIVVIPTCCLILGLLWFLSEDAFMGSIRCISVLVGIASLIWLLIVIIADPNMEEFDLFSEQK